MKKARKLVVFMAIVILATTTVFASTIKIYVNGNEVKSTVAPKVINGTTLVPIRLVSEEIGAIVEWDATDKSILVSKTNRALYMQIGYKQLEVYDAITGETKVINLSVAPQQVNGVTMVPLRAISEGLGCEIAYNNGVIDVTASVVETYISTENEVFIEKNLKKKYSVCATVIGNVNMYFWVYENIDRKSDMPYDYEIYGKLSEDEVEKLTNSFDNEPENAQEVKAQLKAHMQKIASDLMANHPNVKFVGAYDLSYYEDITDEESYVPSFYCNWCNYTEDEKGTYAGSKLNGFAWVSEWDVEVW